VGLTHGLENPQGRKKNVDLLLHSDQRLRPIRSKHNGSWRVPGGLGDSYAEYTGGWVNLVQARQPTSHSLFFDRHGIDRSGTQLFHHDVLVEKNRILIPFPSDSHAQKFWTL
jgi:hypothetical protein